MKKFVFSLFFLLLLFPFVSARIQQISDCTEFSALGVSSLDLSYNDEIHYLSLLKEYSLSDETLTGCTLTVDTLIDIDSVDIQFTKNSKDFEITLFEDADRFVLDGFTIKGLVAGTKIVSDPEKGFVLSLDAGEDFDIVNIDKMGVHVSVAADAENAAIAFKQSSTEFSTVDTTLRAPTFDLYVSLSPLGVSTFFVINAYVLELNSPTDVVYYTDDETLEIILNKQESCTLKNEKVFYASVIIKDEEKREGFTFSQDSSDTKGCNHQITLLNKDKKAYDSQVAFVSGTDASSFAFKYEESNLDEGLQTDTSSYSFLLNKDDILTLYAPSSAAQGELVLHGLSDAEKPIEICGVSQYASSLADYAFGEETRFDFTFGDSTCNVDRCVYRGVEEGKGSETTLWCGEEFPQFVIQDIASGDQFFSFDTVFGGWNCNDGTTPVESIACFGADPVSLKISEDAPYIVFHDASFTYFDSISSEDYILDAEKYYIGSYTTEASYLVKVAGEKTTLHLGSLLLEIPGGSEIRNQKNTGESYSLGKGGDYSLKFTQVDDISSDLQYINCCGEAPSDKSGFVHSCAIRESKSFFQNIGEKLRPKTIFLEHQCVSPALDISVDENIKILESNASIVEVVQTISEGREEIQSYFSFSDRVHSMEERTFSGSNEEAAGYILSSSCADNYYHNEKNAADDLYWYRCSTAGSYFACENNELGEAKSSLGPFTQAGEGHWVIEDCGLSSSGNEFCGSCSIDLNSDYYVYADDKSTSLYYSLNQERSLVNSGYLAGHITGETLKRIYCSDYTPYCNPSGFQGAVAGNIGEKSDESSVSICYAADSFQAPSLEECILCQDDRECDEWYSCVGGECVGESLQAGSYTCGDCSLEESKAYVVYRAVLDEKSTYLVSEDSDVSTQFLEGFIIDGSGPCDELDRESQRSGSSRADIYCLGEEQLFLGAVRKYELSQAPPEIEKQSFFDWVFRYRP